MKKTIPVISILILFLALTAGMASAQAADELKLGLSRDFGYGGFNNDIQGLFTMKIREAPTNLARVSFFIDSTSIGDVNQPPFSLQFNTDSYPLGIHTLCALGYTTEGNQIPSNQIQVQFVAAGSGTKSVGLIIGAVVGILIIGVVISFGVPMLFDKGKLASLPLGTPRKYGIGGGAVCPKCGRPHPIRLWWMNLGFNKIDRCPFCGKWSFVRPRSLEELRKAEQAELVQALPENPIIGETETEKLKKELDDSRYQDV
ncbi:MAG TPA: Ig-like domain-containing protein [Anaerolineales bacterium]|nr:Ig-like domain-containing protein [Anaerolineales bacterium]